MPKKSYKIEFVNKQEMLGMPKDRDWALISNYADKTLMRNYLGVYLLTETIKNGKFRVNIPNGTSFFIAEITENKQQNDQLIYSHILKNDSTGTQFKIHRPKNASTESLLAIKNKIETFESYLKTIKKRQNNFKRWNILRNTEYVYHRKSFNHDKEAVEDLKNWIQTRIQWIDNHI